MSLSKPKFKIGQTVRCIGTSEGMGSNLSFGGCGWKLDRKFKIVYITKDSPPYIYWGSGNNYGVWEHHLELFEKKIKPYGIVTFMNSINKK
jgi:hypothetical protein